MNKISVIIPAFNEEEYIGETLSALKGSDLEIILVDNGSTDNCAIQSLSINGPGAYSCADIGSFNVVLSVEDTSGNISTASAPLTVQDVFGPNIITQDITVNLDNNGMATIAAADIDNGLQITAELGHSL
jgi:glycosyltransferase involved in cell wall biosynthesis